MRGLLGSGPYIVTKCSREGVVEGEEVATASSDLLLVFHMGQLHVLLLGGGWGLLQVATNHELVHKDTRNGAQEWGDDRHPPPVPAGPRGQIHVIRGWWSRAEERQAGVNWVGTVLT
jgi:hypothetical protein